MTFLYFHHLNSKRKNKPLKIANIYIYIYGRIFCVLILKSVLLYLFKFIYKVANKVLQCIANMFLLKYIIAI